MSNKYSTPMRIAHHLVLAIFLFTFSIGFYMVEVMNKESIYRTDAYMIHKSFGVLLFVLSFERVMARIFKKNPRNPILFARILHVVLYTMMFIVPIAGYLLSNAHGRQVLFFEIPLPIIIGYSKDLGVFFEYTHAYLAYVFAATVLLHALYLVCLYNSAARAKAKAIFKMMF